jgi:hypothetical protein
MRDRAVGIATGWGSHGSAVGIATGYRLEDRGVGVRVPVGPLLHIVQSCSVARSSTYPVGNRCCFRPGEMRRGPEADHSSPTSADVTKPCLYTSTPPIRLHDVLRGYLSTGTTLTFLPLTFHRGWQGCENSELQQFLACQLPGGKEVVILTRLPHPTLKEAPNTNFW